MSSSVSHGERCSLTGNKVGGAAFLIVVLSRLRYCANDRYESTEFLVGQVLINDKGIAGSNRVCRAYGRW